MAESTKFPSLKDEFNEAWDISSAVYDQIFAFFCEHHTGQIIAATMAALPFVIVLTGQVLLVLVARTAPKLIEPVAIGILGIIARIRKDGQPEFNNVIGAAMSEFLGVEVDGQSLPVGDGVEGNLKRARAIGDKLHALLETEFKPAGLATPKEGADAARAFTGYNINFSVSNAFVSILCELFSDDHLTQMRELGVEVAENLGLGHLHRRALQPLIQNLIATPYDQWLKAKYRPDRLSDTEICRAFWSGRMSEQDTRNELAAKGYRDEYITEVILQNKPRPQPAQLYAQLLLKKITKQNAIDQLREGGMPTDMAEGQLDYLAFLDIKARQDQLVTEVLQRAFDGFMTTSEAGNIFDRLPMSDEEKQLLLDIVGAKRERPRKRLTFGEVDKLFKAAQLTLDDVTVWAFNEGYSDEDIFNLELIMLADRQKVLDTALHKKSIAKQIAALTGEPEAPTA